MMMKKNSTELPGWPVYQTNLALLTSWTQTDRQTSRQTDRQTDRQKQQICYDQQTKDEENKERRSFKISAIKKDYIIKIKINL